MVEQIVGNIVPSVLDDIQVAPRRCTKQREVVTIDERRLKDMQAYRLDDRGRLKEAMSRTGFFTRYDYCDLYSNELKFYLVLDPNHQLFERAVRAHDGNWVIERLNPAKGKVEPVANAYTVCKVDEFGNISRVDALGNKDGLNIRMDKRQQFDALTPTRSWLSI
jgi:hypothetical protein